MTQESAQIQQYLHEKLRVLTHTPAGMQVVAAVDDAVAVAAIVVAVVVVAGFAVEAAAPAIAAAAGFYSEDAV